jgi:broad specificity phosphatase PhoE
MNAMEGTEPGPPANEDPLLVNYRTCGLKAAATFLSKFLVCRVAHVNGSDADCKKDTVAEQDDSAAVAQDRGIGCTYDSQSTTVKMLYLVRHGEAAHNVLEKEAQRQAAVEAEALGYSKGSDSYKAMLEMARKAVLNDDNQEDPELSPAGSTQALGTRKELARLTSENHLSERLPEPTLVLVSPLRRTLQTAALVFPNHPQVCVHTLVQERQTGLACDTPGSLVHASRQKEFAFMDFCVALTSEARLRIGSSPKAGIERASCSQRELGSKTSTGDIRRTHSDSCIAEIEDSRKLRQRTTRIIDYLRTCEDNVICVVSHKGYLRELERGPLGRPEAVEFGTGEIRVYKVLLRPDGAVAAIRYSEEIRAAGA